MLACSAASSLVGVKGSQRAGDQVPSVQADFSDSCLKKNVVRSPSIYVWEDEEKVEHSSIFQGEGGEQGPTDALVVGSCRREFGRVLRRLIVSPVLEWVSHALQRNLFSHAQIREHVGKTQVWNRSGIRPEGCEFVGEDRAAGTRDHVFVWVW